MPTSTCNGQKRNTIGLGHGIYFWEGNPARAMEWAEARETEGKIEIPFVVGAIIDLRHCLDLFDSGGLREASVAHAELVKTLLDCLVNSAHCQFKIGRYRYPF